MEPSKIYDHVREHYSAAASQDTSTSKYGEAVAKSFGYTEDELSTIPQDANLGLSCGNPTAIASLRPGETVIDLGSGAGFDAFLASSKVGPDGRMIGVDMNDDMLARANKIKASKGREADNVTFVKAAITSITPLESGIADCIISNCVINLVPEPEKQLVFNEMYRLLKPRGRVALSDILAKKPLPKKLREDVAMYVGCIAGASQVQDYEQYLKNAGFDEAVIADTHADLNVYLDTNTDGTRKTSSCCGPPAPEGQPAESQSAGCCRPSSGNTTAQASSDVTDLNEWVGSYKVYALKM
ncbi:S-adenosyl-L-methionine-dependent methyltransferase [Diplogelasinospora grovesii]|uniref:Arsenite methyltransferase n=1 Tax=Diplogelasinospora grovesii TaxID=303347 RepID=A0AAN6NA40_9PEZI|nr:S-adenosyl-L-methionine-dependent methyltransferase [Diplogelasinospora grovesii]